MFGGIPWAFAVSPEDTGVSRHYSNVAAPVSISIRTETLLVSRVSRSTTGSGTAGMRD